MTHDAAWTVFDSLKTVSNRLDSTCPDRAGVFHLAPDVELGKVTHTRRYLIPVLNGIDDFSNIFSDVTNRFPNCDLR